MSPREDVAELVGLVDRLEVLLERSGFSEIEVEVGQTTVILRSPDALGPLTVSTLPAPPRALALEPTSALSDEAQENSAHRVLAPLTGVFYLSPTPDSEPYIRAGGQVNTGQVIGLIEAMKLFNEIKSDVTGTVRRISASDGDLVKAKQTLLEVDPA